MDKEIWKEIVGFEGYYEVSNFGRVRSLPKFRFVQRGECGYWRRGREVFVVGGKTKRGYINVSLKLFPLEKKFYIHRLVAIHFIPNLENKKQINHKDGDKGNNYFSNLEWVTNQENRDHAVKNYLSGTKLTLEQAIEIKREYSPRKNGSSKMSKKYGVCRGCIEKLIHKQTKTWQNLL